MEWMLNIARDEVQAQLKKEWKSFHKTGKCSSIVRPLIKETWERCRDLGANPYKYSLENITDQDLIKDKLDKNKSLIKVSEPAIQNLYDFNYVSRTSKLFVAVSDTSGFLLLVRSGEDKSSPANNILYTEWNEKNIGNNAIGTTLFYKEPTVHIGYEQYCIYPHYYAGTGAPIRDPRGNIIGAISVSSRANLSHPHTYGMTLMTASAIERELKIHESMEGLELAYRHRSDVINSISEGLVILDRDNRISFVNNAFEAMCRDMTGFDKSKYLGEHILSFIKDPFMADLITRKHPITDNVSDLVFDNKTITCTMTYRELQEDHFQNTAVLIVNEFSRTKKLVQKVRDISMKYTFADSIGNNKAHLASMEMAKAYAQTDSTILILGESGTGKELVAQSIHNESNRKYGPFVPVNCGSIPKDLIESEFFGYVEGAFTGAKKGGSIGKFEQANSGTIFLDEIGNMPMALQSALLRVLETRTINRIGDSKIIPINVRVIAATNKDLVEGILDNTFRQDLFYRLNVLSLKLLSLRERKDDLELLFRHFMKIYNKKHDKQLTTITPEAWRFLYNYDWPGNVRELRNIVERSVILSQNSTLDIDLLPEEILNYEPDNSGEIPIQNPFFSVKKPEYPDIAHDNELLAVLEMNRWNKSKTAKDLNISRATLYKRMTELGLNK